MAKARQQHSSLQHTHPPPAPLCEHSCGGGEGASSAAAKVISSWYISRLAVGGSHRRCGYNSLSSMRDFPDPDGVAVRSVDRALYGKLTPDGLFRTGQQSVSKSAPLARNPYSVLRRKSWPVLKDMIAAVCLRSSYPTGSAASRVPGDPSAIVEAAPFERLPTQRSFWPCYCATGAASSGPLS
jgi:hypothetical protein